MSWSVYLLRCRDGSFYCGITTDLTRRLKQHRAGHGSKYVRSRLPVMLAFRLSCDSRSQALKTEAWIKKLSRAQKKALAFPAIYGFGGIDGEMQKV